MRQIIRAALVTAALAAPAQAQTGPAATPAPEEMRELVEAARATAKATRENVEYARVTPDLLVQILAKLDKIEDKLARIEDTLRREPRRPAR